MQRLPPNPWVGIDGGAGQQRLGVVNLIVPVEKHPDGGSPRPVVVRRQHLAQQRRLDGMVVADVFYSLG